MPSFVSSCLLLLLASASAIAASMDMPDDPVNGEMVMSTAYEFRMKYGQRLRFASQETLDTFLKDPTTALGDAKLVDAGADDSPSSSALCPICGMEAQSKGGPQHLVHCALHGLTIFIAYMLMLVSMTYDGVLFLCCIAGYVLGYFIFGERREAVPETDSLRGYPSA
ncbi:hypothetical protein P43SY_004679 [Pythium insidiosum]|uniref:Copper transport protein n=1 Tax=Pythium insidiosum TaxID=114742 RepID=A0AAD5M1W7_PYTIN|nr:hypothetical protein P43SY_004679 [Pythium insidiosum]